MSEKGKFNKFSLICCPICVEKEDVEIENDRGCE